MVMVGTRRPEEAKVFDGSAGYHKFKNEDGEEYGSFEVFWHDETMAPPEGWSIEMERTVLKSGWYWWACFPGCLPEGEPSGPFGSSHLALADAEGE